MNCDYGKLKVPPIYTCGEKACYLDPVRKKLVAITPEETVRQKIVAYLLKKLHVPKNMIAIEEALSHYGINSRKRADIVVDYLEETGEGIIRYPLAVIECKAPEVPLGDKSYNQVLEYCGILGAEYAMLTNGVEEICFKYHNNTGEYNIIEKLPRYLKMLEGEYEVKEKVDAWVEIPFGALEETLQDRFTLLDNPQDAEDISPETEWNKAVATFNLLQGFQDVQHKMPKGKYGLFELLEDYGVRNLSFGNASGGRFFAPYRSFLIEYNGVTQFVSMSISTYWTGCDPIQVKTCLSVGIDNEKKEHHALQLVIDDNVDASGSRFSFYHHGRITIGNMGSRKIDDLRKFVRERYPQILYEQKFYLGTLTNDRLWKMDDPEVITLLVNLITYSLIRDEYRDFVKNGGK